MVSEATQRSLVNLGEVQAVVIELVNQLARADLSSFSLSFVFLFSIYFPSIPVFCFLFFKSPFPYEYV